MEKQENSRTRLLAVFVSLTVTLFIGRLFIVQVARGEYYDNLSRDQVSSQNQYGYFERGEIYFQTLDGNIVTVAGIERGYLLAIKPSEISDPEAAYLKLGAYLNNIDKETFITKASKSEDPYEEIVHRLSEGIRDEIGALNLPWVMLVPEQWRYYPGGTLGANVIGFVGFRGDELGGQYGIERQFDKTLKRDMGNLYKNFFSELFSGVKNEVFSSDSHPANLAEEGTVLLSIEPKVQALIELKTDELMTKWSANQAGILVIEPSTGRIVGASSRPSFNPNSYQVETSPGVYQNPFVEDVFEMGSIMKPITIAAGIDVGVISPSTTYNDKGFLELDGKRIENYDSRGRGVVGMQEVLNESLNTGAAFVALKMGESSYKEYLGRFGFTDKTGIDMPNEANNLLSNLDSGKEIELATASFGQGIAVSPISMVRALGALANKGFLIKPHFVDSVDLDIGLENKTMVTEQGRAISAKTSEEITRMLVKVVDEYLAGGQLKMSHYTIAAKTGTAQIANPGEGGYYADRYMHSFFGYFPAYESRFLVFMYLKEPIGARYASETLTQPFKDITQFLISYYNVPPDR
ncbi:MAG TPA: penicillin-binding protein 2 [Candidatus Paceibacterota bacterium]